MRKYISPNVAFFMGVFMMMAAVVYMTVLTSVFGSIADDQSLALLMCIPTLLLVVIGNYSCIWSVVMRDKLRFSKEADGWVLK